MNKSSTPRGPTTSELWGGVAAAGVIFQIATVEGGPSMEQALCALGIALASVGYSLARAITKRGQG